MLSYRKSSGLEDSPQISLRTPKVPSFHPVQSCTTALLPPVSPWIVSSTHSIPHAASPTENWRLCKATPVYGILGLNLCKDIYLQRLPQENTPCVLKLNYGPECGLKRTDISSPKFSCRSIHTAATLFPKISVSVFLSPYTISKQENSSIRANRGWMCESQGWSPGPRFPDVFSPGVRDPTQLDVQTGDVKS